MAKNQRSATLPPNLRHNPPPADHDSDNFFSKLKKRFKFKKGKYSVDVNTGECDNVAAVSFKRREGKEHLDNESPWVVREIGDRESKSESPKSTKSTLRTQSERFVSTQLKHERKVSVPESQTLLLKNSTVDKDNPTVGLKLSKTIGPTKREINRGNEYSFIKFDKDDPVVTKPLNLENEANVSNECLVHDDSAIDLEHFDADCTQEVNTSLKVNTSFENTDASAFDPGYQRLPDVRKHQSDSSVDFKTSAKDGFEFEPGYASVKDVQNKSKELNSPLTPLSGSSNDFDPNYESVTDVQFKIQKQFPTKDVSVDHQIRISQSIDSLEDPRYQSVKDVKRKIDEQFGEDNMKPQKTYDISKSIESLDEPGYESLNDVKKRVSEQNFNKKMQKDRKDKTAPGIREGIESLKPEKLFGRLDQDVNNSAISFSNDFSNQSSVDLNSGSMDDVNKQLTDSSKSKDSGFESKTERSPDAENEEGLYSKVNKTNATKVENMYSQVKKEVNKKVDAEKTNSGMTETTAGENQGAEIVNKTNDKEEYDSDTELSLDPGYAECADAIKGTIPYGIYSDGNGSKISSCTSLDMSAEDFILEPGYAECADAIKSGAIKKISVSHERLVEMAGGFRKSTDDVSLRPETGSEIYANPQVLFRKRSKLIEDRSSGDFSSASIGRGSDIDNIGSSESLSSNLSLNVVKEVETVETKLVEVVPPVAPPVAPPLPARNYSLYLDNEEAEAIAPSPIDEADETSNTGASDDDAFELEINSKFTDGNRVPVKTEDIETNKQMEMDRDSTPLLSSVACSNISLGKGTHEMNRGEIENETEKTEKEHLKKESNQVDISPENCDYEECIHVTVQDKEGSKMVLKILEKTESFEVTMKRKSVKSKSDSRVHGDDSTTKCENTKCDSIENDKTKDSDPKIENVTFKKNGSVHSTNNCKSQPESYVGISIQNDTGINENDAYQINSVKAETSDENGKINVVNVSEDPIPSLTVDKVGMDKVDINSLDMGKDVIADKTKCDNSSVVVLDKKHARGSLNVHADHLGYVGAVKMQSVSTLDSDSDDLADQLPKLEINESDWECFEFRESENDETNLLTAETCSETISAKSVNEKEEKSQTRSFDKVEQPGEFSVPDVKSEKCDTAKPGIGLFSVNTDVVTVDANKRKVDTEDLDTKLVNPDSYVEGTRSKDNTSDLDRNERSATLESRLCVIDPTFGGHGEVSNLINQSFLNEIELVNEAGERDVGKASGKDITDGNVKAKVQVDVGCENCATGFTESKEAELKNKKVANEQSRLKQLPVLYGDINPNLYRDTEPTHMSLNEVMGSSSYRLSSELDDSVFEMPRTNESDFVVSPNTFLAYIPNNSKTETESNSDQLVPPPRPPHHNSSSQSNNRISGSNQSSHSTVDTPPDEIPHTFVFASGSGQSDDDAPPAIPPRTRVRKQPRPVSASPDFMESMRQLKDCGWYWGPLSWEEAELKLANKPEGTFLVRDSSDERYILSLSFKNQGRVHHTRIEHHKGHFSFWSQPDSHGKSTIKEFIEQCVNNSRNGRFLYFIRPSGPGSPPMPIHLLHPVSRFIQMRSLQHMCRFRILQLVRRDHIELLPVPTRIKQYLKEAQYYVEYLED